MTEEQVLQLIFLIIITGYTLIIAALALIHRKLKKKVRELQ